MIGGCADPVEASRNAPVDHRLALLTPAHLAVLELVAQYKSSKEIARELGISPHTVDQRMKRVQTLMGVGSRFEAARVFAGSADPAPQRAPKAWEPLMYQPSALVADEFEGDNASSVGIQPTDNSPMQLHQTQAAYLQRDETLPWISSLLASGPTNELSPMARTTAIVLLTLAAVLSLAAVVSLAEGLSRLV